MSMLKKVNKKGYIWSDNLMSMPKKVNKLGQIWSGDVMNCAGCPKNCVILFQYLPRLPDFTDPGRLAQDYINIKIRILLVNINDCVCFSPSYRSKRRWKISCFWPRRLWVRWLIQKNDESRLARETFDAFSLHKNLPSLSDSVHKPRSGSLTRIYIKFKTKSL